MEAITVSAPANPQDINSLGSPVLLPFMPNALPATTLPIHHGLRDAQEYVEQQNWYKMQFRYGFSENGKQLHYSVH